MLPAGYAELIRYDGAVVQRDQRETTVPCAVQPRDVQIIHDVWRYKFLTATQLLELHWPSCAPRVGRRRLAKLFEAGFLERFRPITRTGGSFPWTYHLGQEGHRLLRSTGAIHERARFELRTIYDYRYVLHEVHLNAWVIAWRRLLGDALIEWHGETEIEPPRAPGRAPLRLDDDRSVQGLRDDRPRLIRPDAILEIRRRTTDGSRLFFIEYDRTRRLDKNYNKLLRYDAFLCWWWRHTHLGHHHEPPVVIFVCQDNEQRATFINAADRWLTGHIWHPSDRADDHRYVGRDQILFTTELDMHTGEVVAWRVPERPSGHRRDEAQGPRGVRLPQANERPRRPAAGDDEPVRLAG
jgi:hypothetical protein